MKKLKKTEKAPHTNGSNASNSPDNQKPHDVKTARHASRYFIIGVSLAIFNYIFYVFLANIVVKNNDLLWLSSFASTALTAILAYILHSKITWKERDPGKTGIYKFIIWNAILTFAISPGFTQLFALITPLYDLAYNIFNFIHLPFTYEFVQSTGAFIFANLVIMIINFLFYDRFVFGKLK